MYIELYLQKAFHVYRIGQPTVFQILVMFQESYQELEYKVVVVVGLTYFSKAFNQVDNGVLMKKLHEVGIDGKLLKLCLNNLSGR